MLMSFLVVKQIGLNIAEYLTYSVWINHKIKKAIRPYYDELLKIECPDSDWARNKRGRCGCKATKPTLKPDQLFQHPNDPVEVKVLKLMIEIEGQINMKPCDEDFIDDYSEQIIQFGFIALFANSFPLAPLFSFICNLLEIENRVIAMSHYNRRSRCEGASGIGAWLNIMEVIAMCCIPVNAAIIYFTGDSTLIKKG